jgi:hypothetical protein
MDFEGILTRHLNELVVTLATSCPDYRDTKFSAKFVDGNRVIAEFAKNDDRFAAEAKLVKEKESAKFVLESFVETTFHSFARSRLYLFNFFFLGGGSDPLFLSSSLALHFFRLFFLVTPPC